MYQLLFISLLFCFTSCSISKKNARVEKKDSSSITVTHTVTEKHVTEKIYNDTLRAEIPMPVSEKPVAIESRGVSATVTLINERDTAGKITGKRLKIIATAKPVVERTTNETVAEAAQSVEKTAVQITETATVNRKPFRILNILALIGILILVYIFYKTIF